LTLTLRRAGFVATAAVDGVDALEKLAAEAPDLIILDVMMPRLDGLETLHRVREDPATATLPVVLLSAKTQISDRLAGFEHGADDYVAKPFDPSEVVARVRSLLIRTEQARLTRPLLSLLGAWASAEGLAQLGRDLETAREIQSRLIPTTDHPDPARRSPGGRGAEAVHGGGRRLLRCRAHGQEHRGRRGRRVRQGHLRGPPHGDGADAPPGDCQQLE
jgi:CheY-like chemotaxis protein